MDFTQIIITGLGILFAGGISSFFTLKFTKQKAQADAMLSVQDVYQETIKDLRDDKTILKEERDEARSNFAEVIKTVEKNTEDIETLKREKSILKKGICLKKGCSERVQE
jgi:hypothetical protein